MAFHAVEDYVHFKHNRTMTGFRPRRDQGLAVLVLLVAAMATPARAKDLALISNKTGGIGDITMADLVKVCKGQTGRWPDGKLVTLIIREPGSADMKIAVEKIYSLTPQELRELVTVANHGRVDRPAIIVANSDEDVIHRVQSSPGAVGLVDVYSITGAVNVVKIGGKLPLEAGYPLHGN
jgi:ABC-type phosphate transport system substrate-binding protein